MLPFHTLVVYSASELPSTREIAGSISPVGAEMRFSCINYAQFADSRFQNSWFTVFGLLRKRKASVTEPPSSSFLLKNTLLFRKTFLYRHSWNTFTISARRDTVVNAWMTRIANQFLVELLVPILRCYVRAVFVSSTVVLNFQTRQ